MDTDEMRAYLLRARGPRVDTAEAAARLLVELAAEAGGLLAAAGQGEEPARDAVAGYARRRAYVLVRLAELRPEYEGAADAAVAAWAGAEDRLIAAEVAAVRRG
ncbi:hypothetical protein [Streptomyces harbinensis]|uniref:Uncharacterized protein n=1 Tax=Streptomyces harbinensis TaxID=1176198 RepID=A0A1I6WC80_9ACTN|nr:hypothetical protein [Streptomyces harbinensis]SFT23596.1 hypothetical protein SAMN05444716_11910 [Streptomyces harbinensis]